MTRAQNFISIQFPVCVCASKRTNERVCVIQNENTNKQQVIAGWLFTTIINTYL